MAAKGALAMMVLTVNVVGDRASDRREASARRGAQESAPGHRQGQDLAEGDARLHHQYAPFPVGGQDPVQRAGRQDPVTGGQATVAITPSVPKRQGLPSIGPAGPTETEVIPRANASLNTAADAVDTLPRKALYRS